MTSKFENFEHDELTEGSSREQELPSDSFELISAYLDGELSPDAKNQVQKQIDQDPQMKQIYTQLLALQSQIRNLEAPSSKASTDEIAQKVFQSLAHRRRRQSRLVLGGSAIAATLLASVTGLIPGITPPGLRFAQSPNSGEIGADTVMLAVALNKPAINIPKSINGYDFEQSQSNDHEF